MIEDIDKNEVTLYDSKDIKNIFKCGTQQAYEILHTNGFPTIQIGRKLLVERKALEKWIQQNQGKKVLKPHRY